MEEAYLGIDVGSISTKGVIIGRDNDILAGEMQMENILGKSISA